MRRTSKVAAELRLALLLISAFASFALEPPYWPQGFYQADLIGDGADSEDWKHSYWHSSHSDLHGCLGRILTLLVSLAVSAIRSS